MLSEEGSGMGKLYKIMAILTRAGLSNWPLRDEDGVPLGESQTEEELIESLEKLGASPGVEEDTARAVRETLLGPKNASCPFVAAASGEVEDFIACEVEAGVLFFGN